MAKPELAIFNLDGTLVNSVYPHFFEDIAEAGFEPPIEPKRKKVPIKEMQAAALGWLTGKTLVDIQPVLKLTAQRTGRRLLNWAKPVLRTQAEMGRDIVVYSKLMPKPLTAAYGAGIQRAVPNTYVLHSLGAKLKTKMHMFTGEIAAFPKASCVDDFSKENRIGFMAESFGGADNAMGFADYKLWVNPTSIASAEGINRLDYDIHYPFMNYFFAADGSQPQPIDLRQPWQEEVLLQLVLGDDPAFQELSR